MSCNKCDCNSCNCYSSVPNQLCPPASCCPPVVCPSPCPVPPPVLPFPSDGVFTQFARVATTPLEFFAMPAVPKTLIAAPGVGKMIVPIQIWNILDFGTVAYQDITPATPVLNLNLGSFTVVSDATILGSLVDLTTFYASIAGSIGGNLANLPLTLTTLSQPVVGDSVLYSYIVYVTVTI